VINRKGDTNCRRCSGCSCDCLVVVVMDADVRLQTLQLVVVVVSEKDVVVPAEYDEEDE
jgi:hypothetical protein